MLSKVGRYNFTVEPFHCDFEHKLFLGHLGNNMLNAADYHSNERGYGMNYLNPLHRTWVLSRLVMEMEALPKAYDNIGIETWVDNVMRFFTSRDFAVNGLDGFTYGYGRSVWAMIDTLTRQPVDIMAVRDGLITEYIEKSKPCPIDPPSRVRMGKLAQLVRTMEVQYSDIDVNGHTNSVKYIDHILDLWNIEWYHDYAVRRFEIAYVAESHCGDRLAFWREQMGEGDFYVKVTKSDEYGTNTMEVCRSRIKFVKK